MSELAMPPNARPDALGQSPGATASAAASGVANKNRRRFGFGLAKRVLLANVAFVMIAATMIYLPAVSIYRENFLRNRLSAAYTAALVLQAAPHGMISPELSRQLLDSVGARVIVLDMNGTKRILVASNLPPAVDAVFDLRNPSFLTSMARAIETLLAPKGRVITILGDAPMGGEAVAITIDEERLKLKMEAYSQRLLVMTLVMSAIVACLGHPRPHGMVLRPMRRLTTNLTDFGADPENAARIIAPSGRNDEIGQAEAALAVMQESLVRELTQKKNLAALGLAVAKINHDMRNMLALGATAVGPARKRHRSAGPARRAETGRNARPRDPLLPGDHDLWPRRRGSRPNCDASPCGLSSMRRLRALRQIPTAISKSSTMSPAILKSSPTPSSCSACWSTSSAMARTRCQSAGPSPGWPPQVRVSAHAEGYVATAKGARPAARQTVIEIADTGPGVPAPARAKLFSAFFTSGRAGGTGLGLVIASDLVRAHGGSLTLAPAARAEPSGAHGEPPGARFLIALPIRETGAGGDAKPGSAGATDASTFEATLS